MLGGAAVTLLPLRYLRRPPRAGARNRSPARQDNPILVSRFGGKDRNCRSSCVVRDEQSRSDVWKAGVLCRWGKGTGGSEPRRRRNEAQGWRRRKEEEFALVPAMGRLALTAL